MFQCPKTLPRFVTNLSLIPIWNNQQVFITQPSNSNLSKDCKPDILLINKNLKSWITVKLPILYKNVEPKQCLNNHSKITLKTKRFFSDLWTECNSTIITLAPWKPPKYSTNLLTRNKLQSIDQLKESKRKLLLSTCCALLRGKLI